MTTRLLAPFALLNLALAVSACAEDLKTKDDGDVTLDLTIESVDKGDGLHETVVNATDKEKYVYYFDLDEAAPAEADSAEWDLGFLRYKIKTNGGVNGDGNVVVAKLSDEDFDALSKAPDSGYVEDSNAVSSKSENGDPNFGFLGAEPWYDYVENHQLSPKDVVYVVRSTEAKFYKIAILDYYDASGTAGVMKFEWAEIEAPDGEVKVGEQASEGEGEAPPITNEAAAGCYDIMVHQCTCDGDEAACKEAMGTWTDRCNCPAS